MLQHPTGPATAQRNTSGDALHRALTTLVLLFAITAPTFADPGHDHDTEASRTPETALPRFTAVSDQFELVGVLNGKTLTVYLDHAATNAPVKEAKLELELGGKAIPLERRGEGEFVASLAEAPQTGEIPVTATVIAGKESDLLAGEVHLHDDAKKPEQHDSPPRWQTWLAWGSGAVTLLAVAIFLLRARGNRTSHAATGEEA